MVSFVGAGGMGEVYRAVHAKLGRAVAVKLLTGGGDSGFLERFWNEARLHASLHHPNIAELYDFLEHDGRPCIVMEYVDGQTLSERIRAGRLPPPEAMAIFKAVAAAMAYVHEQGIVHRDLKAANVRIGGRGAVKLLDFGIAKGGATPPLTATGAVIGTLLYMAPEQLRGEAATPRSDVWSLGVMLYEMVVGRVPFRAEAVGELIDRLASGAYDPPSAACQALGGSATGLATIDRIVNRCLRRNPGDRYPSAVELARDLEEPQAERRERVPVAGALSPAKAGAPEPVRRPAAWPAWFRKRYLAWGLGVLALFGALATYAAWPTRPEPAPAPATGREVVPVPSPARPVPQRAGASVHRIDVAEGKAEVFVNGTPRGSTPFDYEARPNETIRLELRQDGFLPMTETFEVTERQVWTFAMRRTQDRQE